MAADEVIDMKGREFMVRSVRIDRLDPWLARPEGRQ